MLKSELAANSDAFGDKKMTGREREDRPGYLLLVVEARAVGGGGGGMLGNRGGELAAGARPVG